MDHHIEYWGYKMNKLKPITDEPFIEMIVDMMADYHYIYKEYP